MRWIIGIRALFRLLMIFVQALREGNPYAQLALGLIVAVALFAGFLKFARRPLGGDPEKPPMDEADFQDKKNPYRNLS